MGTVVISLLPMILGSAIVPVFLIINLIVLMGANGSVRSAALIGGVTLARLIQGVLFGSVFGASPASSSAGGPSRVTATLLVVVGLLFAITGVKAYRDDPDPDDPPPKWMIMADSLTSIKIFLLGAVWVLLGAKLWAFTLSAISTIREANLSLSESVIIYLIYALGCVLFFLVPLLMVVMAPEPSKATLGSLRAWLERKNRVIMIILSAIFGSLFLYKGITGLIG